ncbi:hypothetical protein LOD99_16237 [Oopsacas minuta]|uniref:Uncharacterized protein n=1 Tax=Oopsacas minuta TaxID=111878 RepID=A0AAV7K8A1_9METZ|nr:hypothetical protein LOD99_16237 [Oopsacas minuta]
MPKLDVIFENSNQSLFGKQTQFSLYLSLLIIYQLSNTAALYLCSIADKCNLLELYVDCAEKFGEIFTIQCLSYQFKGPYLKIVGKKKQTQTYTGVGKMDERDLEKLMYLTNLPTPEGSSPNPTCSAHTPHTEISHNVFKEGDKIQFKIQTKQRQVAKPMDLENTKLEHSDVNTNFKTRGIEQSRLDISCDLRTVF